MYEFICFTETWIDDSIFDNELFCSRYNLFRADRKFQHLGLIRGGRVLCAVDKKCIVSPINLNESTINIPSVDILGLKVKINHYTFILLIIYIPPNSAAGVYEELFESLIHLEPIQIWDTCFIGDFNLPEYNESNIASTSSKLRALQNFSRFYNRYPPWYIEDNM